MKKFFCKNRNYIIMLLIFILIFAQNYCAFISFDDFGYATLTYGRDTSVLHNINVIEIMKFLKWHYFNWGGRVIVFFVLIILLNINTIVIKILQSLIIFGCFYMFSRIVNEEKNKMNLYNFIFAFSFFCLIDISIFKDGVMWYSSSVLYLWSSIFAAAMIVFFFSCSNINKKAKIMMIPVFFICGWTHEFTGCMLCLSLFLYILFRIMAKRNIDRFHILYFLSSSLGYLILILSPGNAIRAKKSSSFYGISFFSRLISRVKEETNRAFSIQLMPVILLCFICIFIISIYIIKNRRNKLNSISAAAVIILGILYIVIYKMQIIVSLRTKFVFLAVFAVLLIYLIVYESIISGKEMVITLAAGNAGLFAACMLVQYCGPRTLLPFYIFVPLMFFYTLKETDTKLNAFFVLVVFIFAMFNYVYILKGYVHNYPIRANNEKILVQNSLKIRSGENISKIILSRYDARFAESTPWGIESFQNEWVRNFYKIPQNVKIIYKIK